MPAVNVQDSAHTDPRLTACARALRMSRPALLVSCMQLWGRVLSQGRAVMRVELVAGALGKRPAAVGAALGLYELATVDGDLLDLTPMADMFGGPPGAVAERTDAGADTKLQARRDRVAREVLDALGNDTLTRRELAAKVCRRRSLTLDVVRELVAAGSLAAEGQSVRVAVPSSVTESAPVPTEVPVRNSKNGSGSGSVPSPFSPPTPPSYTPTLENPSPPGARDPGQFTRLYAKLNTVVATVAPQGAVRLLGAVNVLHSIRECLNHPAIREQGEADIERALELLGVQAKAKADAGDPDPWWLLENAWSPGVLEKALKCRDEDTARRRAVGRVGSLQARQAVLPVSQPPASLEEFQQAAARKKAEKEARRAATDQAR